MSDEKRKDGRPDPDALLQKINQDARGKLTVFLGAAAGVGKTYSMLETAHQRLSEDVDVVIGWIDTHGRQETEKLVEGLPRIAPKLLEYRGKQLPEMDIDAILARKPELVLVDELAHTNVSGSRHVRRFQDVEELINAGINVYTTLNIQHIESLNDIVTQITGVTVRETVPDYILDQANQVQLIDIPPEELIKRLKEGKVYVPGQAERALQHFFRPGNINALRELSLRIMAHRVDKDLTEYMQEHKIEGPWPAGERVMVCVSASPFSAQLIRAARRLSRGLQADLLAVHIETNRRFPMGERERDRIARNMRLAEELGARTLTVAGQDLVEELLQAARSHNVTHIVVGKPLHSRLWELVHGGALVDKLIHYSGGINIHVIQGRLEQNVPRIKTKAPLRSVPWTHYVGGILLLSLVTGISCLWQQQLELINVAMLYLLPVLLSALWWGKSPSYITAVASVLIFDFMFVPPVQSFTVADMRYLWSFAIFLLAAFVVGRQTEQLRSEAALVRQREVRTRALYEFSREIAAVTDIDVIVTGFVKKASDTLDRAVVVWLPDSNDKLILWAQSEIDPGVRQDSDSQYTVRLVKGMLEDASEAAVALWAYEHGQIAGRSTETLPGAGFMYLPLKTGGQTLGVLGIHIKEKLITPEQRRLIEAWTGLAAVAVERVKLGEQARQTALLVESDRLRTALFNSISHELRTPLSTIIGAVSTLLDAEELYSVQARRDLLETVKDGATRMNRVVANLLDTARLESGMMNLKIDWCDVEDVVGAALHRLNDSIKGRSINVVIPEDLPLIKADCALLEQVLVNLIDNALKYSPVSSPISITATVDKDTVQVSVADRGVGIPTQDISKVFDKFFRVRQAKQVSGTGLGLSICKNIIEAHGGTIRAANRPKGGLVISFTVPAGKNDDMPVEVGDVNAR